LAWHPVAAKVPAVKIGIRVLAIAALCAGLAAFPLFAQAPKPDSAAAPLKLTAQQERGAKAFLAYCSMCHGERGAGDGPVAGELARSEGAKPAHLDDAARIEKLGVRGVRNVIVRGGSHTGRSNMMPAWGEHLAPGVVDDIAAYVMVLPALGPGIPSATIAKYLAAPAGTPAAGRKLFVTFCTGCHGPQGKGDGFNADTLHARHNIRPRNLTETAYFAKKTDQELYSTIALGGGHTGKSAFMPGWTYRLAPAQIKDLVSYVRAISKTPSKP
jgi:cbb3-type cytochrome c oxidase subunit III